MNYKIEHTEYVTDPREWDNLTKMICFHRRYDLGDAHTYNSSDYNGWSELLAQLHKDFNIVAVKPLYLYDHSGITISTSPFACRWDSGQVGFVFVTREDLLRNFNKKRLTRKLRDIAEEALEEETKTYDAYISGDTYIIRHENGYVDGAFYGYDEAIEALKNYKSEVQLPQN